jgi:hypothetical protein
MTKSTITRKQALENALIFCNYANVTALTIEGYEGIDWVETANVLAKMHEQVAKPRAKAVSKARKMNENLAEWVFDNAPTDAITTKDVVALGNPDIATTQKASAVLRVGTEMGFFEKVVDRKKVTYNKIAE